MIGSLAIFITCALFQRHRQTPAIGSARGLLAVQELIGSCDQLVDRLDHVDRMIVRL
jgi:hypothetical protein